MPLQAVEAELDKLIEEYYQVREGREEDHPQVQYVVAEFWRRLKAYEETQDARR